MKSIYVWLSLVLLLLAGCEQDAGPLAATNAAPPTIASDKADYAPGELVTLTGSNWQPSESVQIVVDDDGLDIEQPFKRTVTVLADESGTFTDKFNLPDKFVADYKVTATGEQSGIAVATFTDGNIKFATNLNAVSFNGSWTKHTANTCLTANLGGTTPTSGSGNVEAQGNTLAAGATNGEWIKITAPATDGNYTFTGWSGPDSFASTNATLCAPGFKNGTVTYTANYVAVPAVTTTTTLTSSKNPSTSGDSVTFTATVAATAGSTAPTGSVTFKDGITTLGTGTLTRVSTTNTATASYSTSALTTGSHNITAAYGGATGFATSTSAALTQQVNAACTKPSITTQPVSLVTAVGTAVTFSVVAEGTGTLSYQWRKGGTDIQGATASSYDLTTVGTEDAGDYTVKISNSCGSVTSDVATLTVNKAAATISLSNLTHIYDGSTKAATATTSPENLDGLSISYSQNGNAVSKPTNAGSYAVIAKLDNAKYIAPDVTGTLVIGKANQTITWNDPAAITYGTALSDTQLNASTNEGGSLTYNYGAGTKLDAGTYTLEVTAAATDNYNEATKEVSLTVNQAEQIISWNAPDAITYGTPLGNDQLSAHLETGEGELSYDPPAGTVLGAGTQRLVVSAVATKNYKAADLEVSLVVNKADQTITFEQPISPATFGSSFAVGASSSANLTVSLGAGGGCSISGDTVTMTSGTNACVLTASQAGDSNHNPASSVERSVEAAKADAIISVTGGTYIYDGTAKGATGSAEGVKGEDLNSLLGLGGSFTNVPGGPANWSFTGNSDYNSASGKVLFDIIKTNQTITWDTPAAITYGTALSDTQLNASTNGGGSLTYNYGAGTTLDAGNYTLRVTAAATDNYNEATKEVGLTVNQADQRISWATPSAIVYGTPLSSTQLNASLTKGDGTLSYSPTANTILPVGSHTLTVSAAQTTNYKSTDAKVQLTVNPWQFKGFYQPIDMNGVYNVAKAGSAIPVKFSLGGNKGLNIFEAGYPKVVTVSCPTSAALDTVEELVTATTSGLKYDATADQYNYTWKTSSWAGTCRRLEVKLVDGQTYSAYFKFNK